MAGDVRRYPTLSGGAEDVLVLKPDVVVASLFDKRTTRELLKANGLRLAELAVPRNLTEVKGQIRELGDIAGHPDRAAREIAKLDAALARARQAVAEKHYRVLPLSRRGWVAGSDSFVGSLLAETGLFNIAGDLGFAFGGFASLEAIVNARPDLLLVSQAGDFARDDGQAFLLHPALERFYPAAKRIVIPGTADRMRRRAGWRKRWMCWCRSWSGSLPSSLRTQGPITADDCGYDKSSNSTLKSMEHAVWVPAFAGTTDYPVSTGPPAFFHASMPPAMCAVLARPGFLGGGHRHRRALAEGAEEHDAAAGRRRHFAQHAAGSQGLADRGIGRVQRARQRAVLGALAVFAQVDQQDIGPAEAVDALARAERQALFGEIVLMQADMHVGRHHHIHQFSDWAASDWPSARYIRRPSAPAAAD